MVTERPREASEVLVEEEHAALHTRRPLDFVRLAIAVLAGTALIALASVAWTTFDDLGPGPVRLRRPGARARRGRRHRCPAFVQLLLYPAMLVVLLQRRWFRLAAELVVAVIMAVALSWLATELLLNSSVEGIVNAFKPSEDAQRGDSPVPGSVAAIVAAFTATPLLIRGLRIAGYLALAGGLVTGLLDAGYDRPRRDPCGADRLGLRVGRPHRVRRTNLPAARASACRAAAPAWDRADGVTTGGRRQPDPLRRTHRGEWTARPRRAGPAPAGHRVPDSSSSVDCGCARSSCHVRRSRSQAASSDACFSPMPPCSPAYGRRTPFLQLLLSPTRRPSRSNTSTVRAWTLSRVTTSATPPSTTCGPRWPGCATPASPTRR